MTDDIQALRNQRADALARAQDLAERLQRLYDALSWMSGASDFQEGGLAREGFEGMVKPLLEDPNNGIRAGLQRAIQTDRDMLRLRAAVAGTSYETAALLSVDHLVDRATALNELAEACRNSGAKGDFTDSMIEALANVR